MFCEVCVTGRETKFKAYSEGDLESVISVDDFHTGEGTSAAECHISSTPDYSSPITQDKNHAGSRLTCPSSRPMVRPSTQSALVRAYASESPSPKIVLRITMERENKRKRTPRWFSEKVVLATRASIPIESLCALNVSAWYLVFT